MLGEWNKYASGAAHRFEDRAAGALGKGQEQVEISVEVSVVIVIQPCKAIPFDHGVSAIIRAIPPAMAAARTMPTRTTVPVMAGSKVGVRGKVLDIWRGCVGSVDEGGLYKVGDFGFERGCSYDVSERGVGGRLSRARNAMTVTTPSATTPATIIRICWLLMVGGVIERTMPQSGRARINKKMIHEM